MTNGVVSIGRRDYAVNLYWQISPSGRVLQSAREAARQSSPPTEFVAVRAENRSGRVPQFGLGQNALGHRQGLPSLAGTLAESYPGSWAGAFRLREGICVIIVREDLITPDGDAIYEDENEARQRLIQEVNLGGLQRVYAPEGWSIPSIDSTPLALLLQGRAECTLKPVEVSRQAVVATVVVALLLGGGVVAWNLWQAEQRRADQERMARQEQESQLQKKNYNGLTTEEVYPPWPRTWEMSPRATEWLQACMDALRTLPVGVAGWQAGDMSCVDGAASVTWTRAAGPAELPPGAEPPTMLSNQWQGTVPVKMPPERGAEELWGNRQVQQTFLNRNWELSELSLQPDDPVPPPKVPDGYVGELPPPPPPPEWVKYKVVFKFMGTPWANMQSFVDVPGLVVKTVKTTSGSWTMEGMIYEKRHEK
ncbi:MAG: type 4b pilus protein PilO2 [Alphaproteobacteria bacterium]|nr:MAG: type 4b pilus protein PilO2 [Alphaproteobacteria bacterium]